MSAYGPRLLLVFGLLLVAAIFLFSPTERSQDNGRASADRFPTAVSRDDERFWVGVVIYCNRDDPDLFVPKRYSWGWTMNSACP